MKKIFILLIALVCIISQTKTEDRRFDFRKAIFKNDLKDAKVDLLSNQILGDSFTLHSGHTLEFAAPETAQISRYKIIPNNKEPKEFNFTTIWKYIGFPKSGHENDDIYITFKKGFFSGYKFSVEYKPHELKISGPNPEEEEGLNPTEQLAKMLGVNSYEIENPRATTAMKIFSGTTDETVFKRKFPNIDALSQEYITMSDQLESLKLKLYADGATKNAASIERTQVLFDFLNKAYKLLAERFRKSQLSNIE